MVVINAFLFSSLSLENQITESKPQRSTTAAVVVSKRTFKLQNFSRMCSLCVLDSTFIEQFVNMPDSGDTRRNHTTKQRDLDKQVFYHVVRLLECEQFMAIYRTLCHNSQVVIFSNSSSGREERVHCACRCRVSTLPTVVTGDNKIRREILGQLFKRLQRPFRGWQFLGSLCRRRLLVSQRLVKLHDPSVFKRHLRAFQGWQFLSSLCRRCLLIFQSLVKLHDPLVDSVEDNVYFHQ